MCLSANIHATDFKLDVMFYCGFVVDNVVYPSLSTTDTAKHNLGRSGGRRNSINQLYHSSASCLIAEIRNLKIF
jgi:hypothetical protein